MRSSIDISENDLLRQSSELLAELLRDHTTAKNIFWATDDYEALGAEYGYYAPITISSITGERGTIIQPRVLKSRAEQMGRTKDRAEVFTPSWLCNAQNNLIDEAWFGRKDVFNHEDLETKTWTATTAPIVFPEGKTWKDYVRSTRMEITCGEAPYLVSRYDATTGAYIPIPQRIGMLDRKLRVVSENTNSTGEWLKMAQEAYKSIYAYEWQGDNLLLAREALLMTFVEYYAEKFGKQPELRSIKYIAYIIAWNVFQMDGLKGVVPNSCDTAKTKELKEGEEYDWGANAFEQPDAFEQKCDEATCPACLSGAIKGHRGQACLMRDWGYKDPKTGERNRKIRFIDLIKNNI